MPAQVGGASDQRELGGNSGSDDEPVHARSESAAGEAVGILTEASTSRIVPTQWAAPSMRIPCMVCISASTVTVRSSASTVTEYGKVNSSVTLQGVAAKPGPRSRHGGGGHQATSGRFENSAPTLHIHRRWRSLLVGFRRKQIRQPIAHCRRSARKGEGRERSRVVPARLVGLVR